MKKTYDSRLEPLKYLARANDPIARSFAGFYKCVKEISDPKSGAIPFAVEDLKPRSFEVALYGRTFEFRLLQYFARDGNCALGAIQCFELPNSANLEPNLVFSCTIQSNGKLVDHDYDLKGIDSSGDEDNVNEFPGGYIVFFDAIASAFEKRPEQPS